MRRKIALTFREDYSVKNISSYLSDWYKAVRLETKDVVLEPKIIGSGRYYYLVRHKKKRIAKKNLNRALRFGLPGVEIIHMTSA